MPHSDNYTISVIICSIDGGKFDRVAANYRELLSSGAFEIIRIPDAQSLCEGYNRGIDAARGDVLIFSHDDISIVSPDFRSRILSHLHDVDVLGFAGTSRIVGAKWFEAGHPYIFGQIAHPTRGGGLALTIYGTPAALITGIKAVDGLSFVVRREAACSIRFDDRTFDGFHLYDIDFSFRSHLAGLKVGVATDVAIIHSSVGDFNSEWAIYAARFDQKFAHLFESEVGSRPFSVAVQPIADSAELLKIVTDSIAQPISRMPVQPRPKSALPDLHKRLNSPYYIAHKGSPRRSRKSREIHFLCHALNLAGEEAYLFPTETLPELRTPLLTPEIELRHRTAGLMPIVLYADADEHDNVLGAIKFAYFKNAPGPLPVHAQVFATTPEWMSREADDVQILGVPYVDTRIFHAHAPSVRAGFIVCCDGYPDALEHFADFIAQGTLITETSFPTLEAFAARFRAAERFYAFGDTPLALEAALCGCPVVFVAAPGVAAPSGLLGAHNDGVAFGDDDEQISRARQTLGRLVQRYDQAADEFWEKLRIFVAKTQVARPTERFEQIYDEDSETLFERWRCIQGAPSRIDGDSYRRWRAKRQPTEIDAELFAERMVLKWKAKPLFHLVIELRPGEEPLLADTLDSLSHQLYDRWHVTVVSRTGSNAPDGLKQIEWINASEAIQTNGIVDACVADRESGWVAFIEPGVRLERHALLLIADYSTLQPEWAFIYADEDFVSPRGEFFDPHLKPDFNLDLLRSMHYLGGLCFIRRDAWRPIGGLGVLEGAETYDLALRVLDSFGEKAIGHLAEVIYHFPAASGRTLSPDNERTALVAHLERNGIRGRVQDGHGYATRRVVYEWPDKPLVSVIIPTRDKPEYLAGCLDTLFTRTKYPLIELVIVDNGSDNPETIDLLRRIEGGEGPWPTLVVRDGAPFNYSALCNEGARRARGDYLLFLDNDTAILQDDWLDRLMTSGQRPEVGMVAPRFSVPGSGKIHGTGTVLGLHGLAASPYDHLLHPEDPGYQGRATVDQNVAAVSGGCMLIRRSVFESIGGFDEGNFPVEHAALDLCLRLRGTGHSIAWTPYVTVAHYGKASRNVPAPTAEAAAGRAMSAMRETEALLKRWLPALSNDPFYNRQLSLTTPNRLDPDACITWDTRFHDRPRLIGFPVPGGAGQYRLIQPFDAISGAGLAQTCVVQPQDRRTRVLSVLEMARAAPDSIVIHQSTSEPVLTALKAYRTHLPDTLRVMGLDDLITLLPPRHPSFRKRAVDARSRLRAVLELCDRAVVSTQPLADLCAGLIEDIRVVPNRLDWNVWGNVTPLYEPRGKPRVGWIGAQQHYGDLEHIFEVVGELADEVDWVFMGMCPKPIRPFVREVHSWEHGFESYVGKMASLNLDLAIAPLDVNPFNEAKSNLRLLEYGAMRWPVVCTDIYPYQKAPVTRVSNTTAEWVSAIREKLSDRPAARREGEALRAWVEASFVLQAHADEWLEAFTRPL